ELETTGLIEVERREYGANAYRVRDLLWKLQRRQREVLAARGPFRRRRRPLYQDRDQEEFDDVDSVPEGEVPGEAD
ncbi:MAG: hypothetical protein KGL39_40600, partial [Patescibacteria group bacterium]|nr:hypothetical protein [Patescibacteria group bacterium]